MLELLLKYGIRLKNKKVYPFKFSQSAFFIFFNSNYFTQTNNNQSIKKQLKICLTWFSSKKIV
jgi:hypothetical protein